MKTNTGKIRKTQFLQSEYYVSVFLGSECLPNRPNHEDLHNFPPLLCNRSSSHTNGSKMISHYIFLSNDMY